MYANSKTTFYLTVSETMLSQKLPILLYSDYPQQGILYKNKLEKQNFDYILYKFDVNSPISTIMISLYSQDGGKFTICASNSAAVFSDLPYNEDQYSWCNADFSSIALLRISSKDPYYCRDCSYLILVKSSQFLSNSSISFVITLQFDASFVNLQDNSPYSDKVSIDEYNYYLFPIKQTSWDVIIQLKSLTMTIEIYIIISNFEAKPSRSHYNITANRAEMSEISIKRAEVDNLCYQQYQGIIAQGNCSLYIGVYGWQYAAYILTVSERHSPPTTLPLGQLLNNALLSSNYAYYSSSLSSGSGIALSVLLLSGQVGLLVNLKENADFPTIENSEYESWTTSGGAFIAISPETIEETCQNPICPVIIGVYCLSSYCNFTISAENDRIFPIYEHIPITGSVLPVNYAYYHFKSQQFTTNFVISLSVFSVLDLFLYVSNGKNSRPTAENAIWTASSHSDSLTLVINSTNLALQLQNSLFGDLIIAVRGAEEAEMPFTLEIETNREDLMRIERGKPVNVDMGPWESRYFTYYNDDNATIAFLLSPIYGLITLGVNPSSNSSVFPRIDHSTWLSPASLPLTIPPTDPSYCSNCLYLLGLFSHQQPCSLSISALFPLVLHNAVPVTAIISKSEAQYYLFSLDFVADWDVSVEVYEGNVDLIVSKGALAMQWNKPDISGFEQISMTLAEFNYTTGLYNIEITANTGSSYAIMVHIRHSFISVPDSSPETYSLIGNDKEHLSFKYAILEGKWDVVMCDLKAFTGLFPSHIYASFRDIYDEGLQMDQNAANWQCEYDQKDYNLRENSINILLPAYNKPDGHFILALYAYPHKSMDIFELTCSGKTNAEILVDNIADYWTLSAAQQPKQRFQVYLPESGLLEIVAFPCSGVISLSVSPKSLTFSDNTPENVVISTVVDGKLHAELTNLQGLYYITVSLIGGAKEASYQLRSSFYANYSLRPKQIVPGNKGEIHWKSSSPGAVYFSWNPPIYEDNSTISADIVSYQVYIALSPKVKMDSVCRVQIAQDLGDVWPALPDFITETSVVAYLAPMNNYDTAVVNVIARIKTDMQSVYIAYKPVVLVAKPLKEGNIEIAALTWVLGVGLVIALLGLLALGWKYRQIHLILENQAQREEQEASVPILEETPPHYQALELSA